MKFIKKIGIGAWRGYKKLRSRCRIFQYKIGGKQPWSAGYFEYKWQEISRAISDRGLADTLTGGKELPLGYGKGIDERIVEYPWMLANIPETEGALLDAGSALNFRALLSHPKLENKKISIVTLKPESNCFWLRGVSYLFGDLRTLPFVDNFFDVATCISTLEHIGMDNTMIYTDDERYKENRSGDYLKVVAELRRVLKPGGRLLITVPFGGYHNFGFFQQFDWQMARGLVDDFDGRDFHIDFYKYSKDGWQISNREQCESAKYFDIHTSKKIEPDSAAAARAVACLILHK